MSSHAVEVCTDYFGSELLHPDKQQVRLHECAESIRRSGVEFDAIAFTGVSGALCAPVVAFILHKPLIVVRKEDDRSSHSCMTVEGDMGARTFIVVDDFFSSGRTLCRIIEEIRKWSGAQCVGAITAKYDDPYLPGIGYVDPVYNGPPAFAPQFKTVRNLAYKGGY